MSRIKKEQLFCFYPAYPVKSLLKRGVAAQVWLLLRSSLTVARILSASGAFGISFK